MRKKGFLIAVAMMILPAAFTSCTKDEDPRDPSHNLKSVDGTEWISSKGTISFSNGKYYLDTRIPGVGTYTQSGSHINFDGQDVSIGAGYVSIESGEISKYGSSMTISFKDASYWNTGEIETVTFIYKVAQD